MMLNPNRACDRKDCKFVYGATITTAMYFTPVYDKEGNNINPDGNITTGEVKCLTCNRAWTSSTQYDKTTFTEIENGK